LPKSLGQAFAENLRQVFSERVGQIPPKYSVIGRNGPLINAHGGDCRVLLFYESFKKTGALIHIGAADIYDNNHELLIDTLLAKVTFGSDSTVLLCGELRHSDKKMVELRKSWDSSMVAYLKQKGLKVSKKIRQYVGKDVYLNTKNSLATIKSDKQKQFFNQYLSSSSAAQRLNLLIGGI
jgi:hypothetical protein